jgi:hypothetical protein
MKSLKYSFILIVSVGLLSLREPVSAQCAMCTLNAENSVKNGQTQGRGLNRGILLLLAAPYLAVGGIGVLWYKKYRRRNVALQIKNEKISLN